MTKDLQDMFKAIDRLREVFDQVVKECSTKRENGVLVGWDAVTIKKRLDEECKKDPTIGAFYGEFKPEVKMDASKLMNVELHYHITSTRVCETINLDFVV